MKNVFKFVLVFFALLAIPSGSYAATYDGGPDAWPKYLADDTPFLVDYKINNLEEGAEYYIKGRLEDSPGKYAGQIFNLSTGKWIKQTDAWTSLPKFIAGKDTSKGSIIMKLPLAASGSYWLQLAIRKAGSSVTDLVQERVAITALNTTESGSGGFIAGIVPGDRPNLVVEAIDNNGINSRYLSEDNAVTEGYDVTAGFFKLPVPASDGQRIIVRDSSGNIAACSQYFNILPGEIKEVEVGALTALDMIVSQPLGNKAYVPNVENAFEALFQTTGGLAEYLISGTITNLTTGQEEDFFQVSSGSAESKVFNSMADGRYRLKLVVTDLLKQSATKEVFFTIDSQSPYGKANVPLFTNKTSLLVDVEHSDDLSEVEAIKLGTGDDLEWQAPKEVFELNLPDIDGEYSVNYIIKDKAGNETAYSYSVILDRIVPQTPEATGNTMFVNKAAAKSFHAQVKCEPLSDNYLTFSDMNNKKINVKIAGNIDGIARKKIDLTELKDGLIEFTIISVDKAGNQSAQASYKMIKDTAVPILNKLNILIDHKGKTIIANLTIDVNDNFSKAHIHIDTIRNNGTIAKRYNYVVRTNRSVTKSIEINKNIFAIRFSVQDPAGNILTKKINLQRYL